MPRLEVAQPAYDFGTVPRGRVLAHEFSITNTGSAVLQITDVVPSCGCTTTGEWPRMLVPGATGLIPIKLDTAPFVGTITKTISIMSNTPGRPETVLTIRANVWTPVSIAHPVLMFPAATDPGHSDTEATTIRNETGGTMTLSDVITTSPVFKPKVTQVIAGREYELTVTTVPPLPEGTHVGRITMKTSMPEAPEIAVQAVLAVVPAVQVAPEKIVFSASPLTSPEKRYAVVFNRRGYDLHLSELTVDAPDVTLAVTKSDDGKQFMIALTFPAGFAIGPGTTFHLRGRTNYPDLREFVIPIVAGTAN